MTMGIYEDAERFYEVYPNVAGQTWPELREALLKFAREKISPLPFVPAEWLPGVEGIAAQGYAPAIISPYMANGTVKKGLPPFLANDEAAQVAWGNLAVETGKIVTSYAAGKLEEGRALIAKLESNAAFWDTLYTVDKFIADLPANTVKVVADGAQHVAGGVFKSLFSSWLVWVGLGGLAIVVAWRAGVLGLVASKVKARVKPAAKEA